MGYRIEWEKTTGQKDYYGTTDADGNVKDYVWNSPERAEETAEKIWLKLCLTYETDYVSVRVVAQDGTIYSEWEV
jgi:hypothetical protein